MVTVEPAQAFERMRVPAQFSEATLGNWIPDSGNGPDILGAVSQWVETWPPPAPFLLFEGQPGNGKTHMAVGVMRAVLGLHNVRSLFISVPQWLDELRDLANPELWTIQRDMELEQAPRNAPLLVLDDIGAEKGTDWTRERLYLLVNDRYSKRQPTVFTSNVALDSIEPRIRSRIQSGIRFGFDGRDRRLLG